MKDGYIKYRCFSFVLLVKLPSGYVVDKSTIARHLLSDQTDPFTRAPLTMEMLEPDVELKSKIEKFVNEYNAKKREEESSKNNESKGDKVNQDEAVKDDDKMQ